MRSGAAFKDLLPHRQGDDEFIKASQSNVSDAAMSWMKVCHSITGHSNMWGRHEYSKLSVTDGSFSADITIYNKMFANVYAWSKLKDWRHQAMQYV